MKTSSFGTCLRGFVGKCLIGSGLLMASMVGSVYSQDLTAQVDWIPSFSGSVPDGTGGQFQLSDPVSGDLIGWAFCVSPDLISPQDGSVKEYNYGVVTDAFRVQNVPATGVGAIHWLMDNYLNDHVIDTRSVVQPEILHLAFDAVFTEILEDWNGNYSNLNLDNGWKALSGSEAYYTEASSMINALVAAAPLGTYTSSNYSISYLTNVTTEEYVSQNLLMVQSVPEPTAVLSAGLGLVAFAMRRRRS